MKKSLRIVFFGNERIATGIDSRPRVLEALAKSRHKVVAVVVHASEGSGRKQRSEPVIELANAHSIPVLNPSSLINFEHTLSEYAADCGVLAAYGKMVPENVISSFPLGIINLHPSALPKYRGSTPIESIILDGAAETAVSIMHLVKEMDAGPIYSQLPLQIPDGISKQELADLLHEMGATEMIRVLDVLDTRQPQPQNEAEATYCSLITKEMGALDFSKPATTLEREIRAYTGWPRSKTKLGGIEVIITKAHAMPMNIPSKKPGGYEFYSDAGILNIETSNGYICVDELQPLGKKEMPVKAFLNGYSSKL